MYSFAGGRSSWVARLPAFMPSISQFEDALAVEALKVFNQRNIDDLIVVNAKTNRWAWWIRRTCRS
jgi:hypothetical protein